MFTYDASSHRHWRLRHDQNLNTMNFETSHDGALWTTRKTVTPEFALTSLRVYLIAGAWGTGNGSPGAAKYDNVNLLASTAPTGAPVNLALNKPATQSSTYIYGDPTPNLAVDGNTDGIWLNHSVASTNNEPQAWWQVDLGATAAVSSVEVWNRTDCCPERLSNFNVILLDGNQATVASVNVTGPGGTPTIVAISGTARYVKVQLAGTNFLSLAEVKVWAAPQ